MAKLVSKTYGDALFDLALESGQVDSLFQEAKAMLLIIKGRPCKNNESSKNRRRRKAKNSRRYF